MKIDLTYNIFNSRGLTRIDSVQVGDHIAIKFTDYWLYRKVSHFERTQVWFTSGTFMVKTSLHDIFIASSRDKVEKYIKSINGELIMANEVE